MRYFRADKRDFSPGDVIQSAQEYYDKFSKIARAVEDALEAHRPLQKVKRATCVFVFADEKYAREHWSKMKNGKLYAVDIDECHILHRGDMALMDEMNAALEDGKDVSELACKYWAGEVSELPKLEVLAPSVTVVETLSKSEVERENYLRKRWGILERRK